MKQNKLSNFISDIRRIIKEEYALLLENEQSYNRVIKLYFADLDRNVARELVERLGKADPTVDKKATYWIAKLYKTKVGTQRAYDFEDETRMRTALDFLFRHKQVFKNNNFSTNLQDYPTLESLEERVALLTGKKTIRQIYKKTVLGAEIIYEDEIYRIECFTVPTQVVDFGKQLDWYGHEESNLCTREINNAILYMGSGKGWGPIYGIYKLGKDKAEHEKHKFTYIQFQMHNAISFNDTRNLPMGDELDKSDPGLKTIVRNLDLGRNIAEKITLLKLISDDYQELVTNYLNSKEIDINEATHLVTQVLNTPNKEVERRIVEQQNFDAAVTYSRVFTTAAPITDNFIIETVKNKIDDLDELLRIFGIFRYSNKITTEVFEKILHVLSTSDVNIDQLLIIRICLYQNFKSSSGPASINELDKKILDKLQREQNYFFSLIIDDLFSQKITTDFSKSVKNLDFIKKILPTDRLFSTIVSSGINTLTSLLMYITRKEANKRSEIAERIFSEYVDFYSKMNSTDAHQIPFINLDALMMSYAIKCLHRKRFIDIGLQNVEEFLLYRHPINTYSMSMPYLLTTGGKRSELLEKHLVEVNKGTLDNTVCDYITVILRDRFSEFEKTINSVHTIVEYCRLLEKINYTKEPINKVRNQLQNRLARGDAYVDR